MTSTRIHRVTVYANDLDRAADDFAAAFAVGMTRADHPRLGVPAALSEAVSIVGRTPHSAPGPLAAVELTTPDIGAASAALTERGLAPEHHADGTLWVDFHGLPFVVTGPAEPVEAAGATRFGRAVLAVDDVDAAVADLAAVFGVSLQAFDVENMRIRVALGEEGIEFIGKLDPQIDIEQLWHWPISGYAVHVDDLDAAKGRMAAAGAVLSYEFITPGGLPEVYYGRPGLHGVPITLMPEHDAGGLLASMGVDGEVGSVAPTMTPGSD
ncbi:MAG TPA: VOC family protein [Ilumatobacteraceae bacterium]|nr:VOC family protein [Ilumatobacteraceae bacterium]